MAPSNPHTQTYFFYINGWSAIYEHEFISRLAEDATANNMNIKRSDVEIIRSAIESVNSKFGINFSFKDAMEKFKQLKNRHQVFGFVVNHPNVTYDLQNNYVIANDFVWDYCTMKYPIAEAYMLCGETHWREMCVIFGEPQPVNVFSKPEVIQISDSQSIPRVADTMNSRRDVPTNPTAGVGPSASRGRNDRSQAGGRDTTDMPHPSNRVDLSELLPGFWNGLGKFVSLSDRNSADSVNYLHPRRPAASGEDASSYGSSNAP